MNSICFEYEVCGKIVMGSIRSLHELCTSRDLQDQDLILFDFSVNFEYLFESFNLNMTLKVHIILHHYQDYFDMKQKSMRFT